MKKLNKKIYKQIKEIKSYKRLMNCKNVFIINKETIYHQDIKIN